MKLYPRQLHSVEELKREKSVLKYARNQTTKEQLLPIDRPSDEVKRTGNDFAAIAGSVLGSGGGDLNSLVSLGLPLMRFLPLRTQKNVFSRFAKELIGGYIRWKALELGFRAVKTIVGARKARHAHAKAHTH